MKNIFKSFLILGLCAFAVNTMAQVRSVPAIPIKKGQVQKTAILADSSGQIFLEFIKGDRVSSDNKDLKVYEGEILPPTVTTAPAKAPRARMRELLSFEIISNTNDNLFFIDQYAALNAHIRKRLSYKDPVKLSARQSGVQILMKIFTEDKIGRPAIWVYDEKKEKKWYRLGGITTESSERKIQVFSSIIYQTGIFTIWDENPGPDFNPEAITHPDEVELVEPSPFPSVEVDESGNRIQAVDENFDYENYNGYKKSANKSDGYNFKNDPDFDKSNESFNEAYLKEGAFIDGNGNIVDGKEIMTKEEYKTKYGINDKTDSEDQGFNVFDNFYNTFDNYFGEDENGNPITVPSLDGGKSVNKGGSGFDDDFSFDKQEISQNINIEKKPSNKDFSYKPAPKQNKSGFTDNDFKNAAPLLQTNLFNSDLSSTGPEKIFNFPWYIFILIFVFGSSIYIAFSKKY